MTHYHRLFLPVREPRRLRTRLLPIWLAKERAIVSATSSSMRSGADRWLCEARHHHADDKAERVRRAFYSVALR